MHVIFVSQRNIHGINKKYNLYINRLKTSQRFLPIPYICALYVLTRKRQYKIKAKENHVLSNDTVLDTAHSKRAAKNVLEKSYSQELKNDFLRRLNRYLYLSSPSKAVFSCQEPSSLVFPSQHHKSCFRSESSLQAFPSEGTPCCFVGQMDYHHL